MKTREDVFSKLKTNPKLPTPSRTALRILHLCRSDTSSLSEIAQVIQVDPALSAEVLKFANSALMNTRIPVASIQKATVNLGMKTIVNLALCFSLLSANKDGTCWEFDYDNFWSTSLARAISAKMIASLGNQNDPDEMFICGLLSKIGELALASLFPREYGAIIYDQPPHSIRIKLERAHFGIDSVELTSELFLDWGLPGPYVQAVKFCQDLNTADLCEPNIKKIAQLLNLACRIAQVCHGMQISKQWLDTIEKMAQKLNCTNQDFGTLFDTIVSQWQEWGDTFDIKTKRCPRFEDIKVGLQE